ncbi:MAG TPA: hypothetical protein VFQ76_00410, partial [Longimicrobiaceae bacterium]|nr:hypothetical protein [Longimicrobiaceae bacterium]
MRQIRLLLGMAGFLVLWLASPAALRAQCGTCSDATDVNGRWQHTFGGLAGAWMGCGSNCHRYFVTGLCLDNHGGCVGALNAGVEKVRVAL